MYAHHNHPGSSLLNSTLVFLLVKLAVAASLASILTRSQPFSAHADAGGKDAGPARPDGRGVRRDLRLRRAGRAF